MKNHTRITGDEIQLPLEIMHHIQSSMDDREAARTALLSKSWYGAWLTRPTLNLDQYWHTNDFWEFAKKTMQRYEEYSNLNIQTFRLRMRHVNHPLATEFIVKAIKSGASDLDVGVPDSDNEPFALPEEVLESETLARLCLSGPFTLTTREVAKYCSNLKCLDLHHLTLYGDFVMYYLISRCPSIEVLKLDSVKKKLGFFRIPPCVRIKLDEKFDRLEFRKLKYLFMKCMDIKDCISRFDFWDKFPCLKELVLCDIYRGWNDVRIRSRSLERVRLECVSISSLELDVPNLQKFEFKSKSNIPVLEFRTPVCGEWESDVHVKHPGNQPGAPWFASLNQFLRMLSLSRVSLYIFVSGRDRWGYNLDYNPRYVGDGLPRPQVENLKVEGYEVTPAFLDSLLWSCCPKFVDVRNRCVIDENVNMEVFQQLSCSLYHGSSTA